MHICELAGQTALVTGASGGIGRAIALALAQRGAFVYVHYGRSEQAAVQTLSMLEEAGGIGALCSFDIRVREQVEAGMSAILEDRGQLDILINNAGITRDAMFAMMPDEDWIEVMETNLHGTYLCSRVAIRQMLRQRRGSIVNVASVSGLHASPGQSNYAASKGAMLSFTKTLAAEVAAKGIRVNAVVPGLIEAGMVLKTDRRRIQEKLRAIPLKRLGTAEEVADVVCFLASEQARYIVGQALVVDGGLTL